MMQRITLEQCKVYFNNNVLMQADAVRQMEQLGYWEQAAIHWLKLNRKSDADACMLIHNSILKGDEIRSQNAKNNELYDILEKEDYTTEQIHKIINKNV